MSAIELGLNWRWWVLKERLAQPFRVLKALFAEVRAPLKIVRCGTCGHYFDAADKRGVVFEEPEDDRRYGKTCPACWIEENGGAPAWALWNDCQGVFACSVTQTKAEAAALLKERGWEDLAEVRPVRVMAEREDRIWHRNYEERDLEKMRRAS